MKRLIILPCLLICVALFATVTALMQESQRQQLGNRDLTQGAAGRRPAPKTSQPEPIAQIDHQERKQRRRRRLR